LAWILRHPGGIQAIVGSTNPKRVAEMSKAITIKMEREEWYDLYRAAGNNLP